jgi:hypothetical protein
MLMLYTERIGTPAGRARVEEQPNPRMDLPERLAACGVLRPPHLRRLSAAHAPVGLSESPLSGKGSDLM